MASAPTLRTVLPEPLAEQVRRIGERHGIRNIRVFGSLARGDARPESDVDLLVEYVPGESGFAFVRFCDEVETLLGRRVDVVTDENLHPLIRDRVLSEAVRL